MSLTLIGFGEAARAFVAGGMAAKTAFDIDPTKRSGIADVRDPVGNFRTAKVVMSLVTADQALLAAQDYAPMLSAGAFYFDMNSVAPGTKQAAAERISSVGAHYLDVAIMAPVEPEALAVPLLVSGPEAATAVGMLIDLGFTDVRMVGDQAGRASSIKMIRSVMVKGIEALTAEMILAARKADVEYEVLASLGDGWDRKVAYNLERMTAHGKRRAAEMEEVSKTLESLGVEPIMTRGAIMRQREMAT